MTCKNAKIATRSESSFRKALLRHLKKKLLVRITDIPHCLPRLSHQVYEEFDSETVTDFLHRHNHLFQITRRGNVVHFEDTSKYKVNWYEYAAVPQVQHKTENSVHVTDNKHLAMERNVGPGQDNAKLSGPSKKVHFLLADGKKGDCRVPVLPVNKRWSQGRSRASRSVCASEISTRKAPTESITLSETAHKTASPDSATNPVSDPLACVPVGSGSSQSLDIEEPLKSAELLAPLTDLNGNVVPTTSLQQDPKGPLRGILGIIVYRDKLKAYIEPLTTASGLAKVLAMKDSYAKAMEDSCPNWLDLKAGFVIYLDAVYAQNRSRTHVATKVWLTKGLCQQRNHNMSDLWFFSALCKHLQTEGSVPISTLPHCLASCNSKMLRLFSSQTKLESFLVQHNQVFHITRQGILVMRDVTVRVADVAGNSDVDHPEKIENCVSKKEAPTGFELDNVEATVLSLQDSHGILVLGSSLIHATFQRLSLDNPSAWNNLKVGCRVHAEIHQENSCENTNTSYKAVRVWLPAVIESSQGAANETLPTSANMLSTSQHFLHNCTGGYLHPISATDAIICYQQLQIRAVVELVYVKGQPASQLPESVLMVNFDAISSPDQMVWLATLVWLGEKPKCNRSLLPWTDPNEVTWKDVDQFYARHSSSTKLFPSSLPSSEDSQYSDISDMSNLENQETNLLVPGGKSQKPNISSNFSKSTADGEVIDWTLE